MSLYDNIRKRKASGKKPRRVGSTNAPTDADFARAALTAKKPKMLWRIVKIRQTPFQLLVTLMAGDMVHGLVLDC